MSLPNTYVLHLDSTGEGKSLPLGLEGLPTKNSEGQPIYYRKMLIVPGDEDWQHVGTGTPMAIPPQRVEEWKKNVMALSEAGIRPYVTTKHIYNDAGNFTTPDARDTLGYVLRIERDGDQAYAIVELHGDEAKNIAAVNGRSIGVSKINRTDAKGNVYAGETLHHLALCPNPALPGLVAPMKIAASADGPPTEIPVYQRAITPTPAQSRKEVYMKPENASQVRAKLGFGADVPDDQLADKTAEVALALSADKATLTTNLDTIKAERDRLKTEKDAESQKVLALSADAPKKLDPITLAMYGENVAAKRELAIKSGAISEASAKTIDALLMDTAGSPTVLALSAAGPSRKPLAFELWDAIGKMTVDDAIKTKNQAPREAEPAIALMLSGDHDPKKPLTHEQWAQTRSVNGLSTSADDYKSYLARRT